MNKLDKIYNLKLDLVKEHFNQLARFNTLDENKSVLEIEIFKRSEKIILDNIDVEYVVVFPNKQKEFF